MHRLSREPRHERVTLRRQTHPVCGAFVAGVTRPCPRFPPLAQDGKEGVDGSSPSEGFENSLQLRQFYAARLSE